MNKIAQELIEKGRKRLRRVELVVADAEVEGVLEVVRGLGVDVEGALAQVHVQREMEKHACQDLPPLDAESPFLGMLCPECGHAFLTGDKLCPVPVHAITEEMEEAFSADEGPVLVECYLYHARCWLRKAREVQFLTQGEKNDD